MQNLDPAATAAIMAAFLKVGAPSAAFIIEEAPALLAQTGVSYDEAGHRVQAQLLRFFGTGAIVRRPCGCLELRREFYPVDLHKRLSCLLWEIEESLTPVGHLTEEMQRTDGIWMPLSSFTNPLKAEFTKLMDQGQIPRVERNGDLVVFEHVFLHYLAEHCRTPSLPLSVFGNHPIMQDVEEGFISPIIRYGVEMIDWDMHSGYAACGSSAFEWVELERRAINDLFIEMAPESC